MENDNYIKELWQNDRTRFFLYAGGYLAVLIFFLIVIYVILIRGIVQDSTPTNTNENENTSTGLPNSNNADVNGSSNVNTNTNSSGTLPEIDSVARGSDTLVKPVASGDLNGVRINGDGITYYDQGTGRFYRLNANGEPEQLSEALYPNATNVQWSPIADQVIFTLPDGNNVFYDITADKQTVLPQEFSDMRFSDTGSQIAYKFYSANEDNRFLGVSSPDGTGIKVIEPLGNETNDVQVNWSPTGQIVATFRSSINGNTQKVFFVGQNGENFEDLEVEGRGFLGEWSPNGKQMLYSIYSAESNYRPSLWIANADGSDTTGTGKLSLGLFTYADKCTFGGESTVYCAVPRALPEGSGLYRDLSDETTDLFYRIDVTTGKSTLIANPVDANRDNNVRASRLTVAPDGSALYFINDVTGDLQSLDLK